MEKYLRGALIRNVEKWAPEIGDLRRHVYFKSLSSHPSLTIETLVRYRNEAWCPFLLAANKNFSWEWVDLFPTKQWNWRSLSFKDPTMDRILRNLDKDWDWTVLTIEPGVTFADMVRWNNLPWNVNQVLFVDISSDTDIEFLRMYKDRYDDIAWVDHSRRATWEVIRKSPDLPWRYTAVKLEIYEPSDVEFLLDKDDINWTRLSATADADIILETKHVGHWNWSAVSVNPTLRYDHVIDNPELPWTYSMVPAEQFSEELARRWMAAFKIQLYWRRAISCPLYRSCRRRLELEFMGDI